MRDIKRVPEVVVRVLLGIAVPDFDEEGAQLLLLDLEQVDEVKVPEHLLQEQQQLLRLREEGAREGGREEVSIETAPIAHHPRHACEAVLTSSSYCHTSKSQLRS